MEFRLLKKWFLSWFGYLVIMAGCNSVAPEQETSNNSNQLDEPQQSKLEKATTIINNEAVELVAEKVVRETPLVKAEKKINPEPKKQSSANLKLSPNIKTELPDFSKYINTIKKKGLFCLSGAYCS